MVTIKLKLKAIGDAIREKNGTTESMQLIDMPQAIKNISNGGNTEELEIMIDESGVLESTDGTVNEKVEQLITKAQWEEVWYKVSEKLTTANKLFEGHTGTTIPRTNLISATSMGYFLGERSTVEYIDYYLDTKKVTSFQYCFRQCNNLKWIVGVNTSNATAVGGMFFSCSALETIQEPLNFIKVTNTGLTFDNCISLRDIKFVEESIKVSIKIPSNYLTTDSIQSIIDGLAYVETQQTLTVGSVVLVKLTEEQLAMITAKNWKVV